MPENPDLNKSNHPKLDLGLYILREYGENPVTTMQLCVDFSVNVYSMQKWLSTMRLDHILKSLPGKKGYQLNATEEEIRKAYISYTIDDILKKKNPQVPSTP